MKKVHIHFVCTGNAYRSRLAEAYLKSKNLPNIIVSSSGIEAEKHYEGNGPISWYAMRLMKRHHLIPHMKPQSTQTASHHLNAADIVIFMTDEQYAYAKLKFQYKHPSFEIWRIGDMNTADFFGTPEDSDLKRIEFSEKTFEEIKNKVDTLAQRLV